MAKKWSGFKCKVGGKMGGSNGLNRILYQMRRSWHEVYKVLNNC